jgi:hypothetical protein
MHTKQSENLKGKRTLGRKGRRVTNNIKEYQTCGVRTWIEFIWLTTKSSDELL